MELDRVTVALSKPTHWLEWPVESVLNHVVMALSTYQKVFDDRKWRVRSLWKRNDCFYARLVIVDEGTGQRPPNAFASKKPAPPSEPFRKTAGSRIFPSPTAAPS
jgi:hypothetical protein